MPHGRGAGSDPPNRFLPNHTAWDGEAAGEGAPAPTTTVLPDRSKTVLSTNDSPDVPFDVSLNPYRGCEHGCAYCYARPTHEYLGFSAGLDFESKILAKHDAPDLLRAELMKPRWKPQVVAMAGVTDVYQPEERELQITRRCLEVFLEFRNPVGVITKSGLVARDADLLAELARFDAASVAISVTTLDEDLASRLEPRAARPNKRLETIGLLAAAGVPVTVMAAPVIPGLNDHELPAILAAARARGARHAGYVALRLPGAVGPLFEEWLERHAPQAREKVLRRVRAMHGGAVDDARFGARMRGDGPLADEVAGLFRVARARAGFGEEPERLSTAHFRRPGPSQGRLFRA